MSDRELLLERLERLAIVLDELMPQCAELVRDAIELLKEQEAKKVNIWLTHCGMKYGLCPKCGKQIDTLVNPNYCGSCGKELKWE